MNFQKPTYSLFLDPPIWKNFNLKYFSNGLVVNKFVHIFNLKIPIKLNLNELSQDLNSILPFFCASIQVRFQVEILVSEFNLKIQITLNIQVFLLDAPTGRSSSINSHFSTIVSIPDTTPILQLENYCHWAQVAEWKNHRLFSCQSLLGGHKGRR